MNLADVEAGGEAVSCECVRRGDDRLDVFVAYAPHDDTEEVSQMTATRLRARRLVARMALLELGNRLVHNPTPCTGEDF